MTEVRPLERNAWSIGGRPQYHGALTARQAFGLTSLFGLTALFTAYQSVGLVLRRLPRTLSTPVRGAARPSSSPRSLSRLGLLSEVHVRDATEGQGEADPFEGGF